MQTSPLYHGARPWVFLFLRSLSFPATGSFAVATFCFVFEIPASYSIVQLSCPSPALSYADQFISVFLSGDKTRASDPHLPHSEWPVSKVFPQQRKRLRRALVLADKIIFFSPFLRLQGLVADYLQLIHFNSKMVGSFVAPIWSIHLCILTDC